MKEEKSKSTPIEAPRRRTKSGASRGSRKGNRGYLDGQMLIAMPSMRDERFARTVIYICAHSSEGAMGIVVNQPAANIRFPDLLVQLEVIADSRPIQLPPSADAVQVLKGGPVEPGRGFVLHSSDFFIENSTLPIDEGICLTATLDVLKAIAHGRRSRQRAACARLCRLGAGPAGDRDPGERLAALQRRPGSDFRRRCRPANMNGRCSKLGIHVGMLSSEAGHA